MTRYFITATGTDVGKTHIASLLLLGWRANGFSVAAAKPVLSGLGELDLNETDSARLLSAMDQTVSEDSVAAMTPWRYQAALSPDMAAAREGKTIPFDDVMAHCQQAVMAHDADRGLIEGAGGVFVPLDDTHTMLDWMGALGTPAILVAGGYLGTISHTLTAIEVLQNHDIKIAAVVISESTDAPVSSEETINALRRFAPSVRYTSVPRVGEDDNGAAIALANFVG